MKYFFYAIASWTIGYSLPNLPSFFGWFLITVFVLFLLWEVFYRTTSLFESYPSDELG